MKSDASAFEGLLQLHDRRKIALNHALALLNPRNRCQAYPGGFGGVVLPPTLEGRAPHAAVPIEACKRVFPIRYLTTRTL